MWCVGFRGHIYSLFLYASNCIFVSNHVSEKECGLHSGNIKKADGTTEARKADRDLWIEGKVAAVSKPQVEALAAGKRDKDTILVLYAPWCTFCQALEPSFSALADQLAGTSVTVAKYQVRQCEGPENVYSMIRCVLIVSLRIFIRILGLFCPPLIPHITFISLSGRRGSRLQH